ncbi:MAG: hypothetical protein IPJ94_27910 [Chloroflexi bacterium]|nr:hypothetical protein [Chloroflexota bacterium]
MKDQRKHLSSLRKEIIERFNEGELRTICFDLGIDFDDLRGDAKSDKARELLEHLERSGRLNALIRLVRELRPGIDWDYLLGDEIGILPALPITTKSKSAEIKFSVCEGI